MRTDPGAPDLERANVREDGTIPQFEKPSWQQLNTFRTNAQISGGTACQPPIL